MWDKSPIRLKKDSTSKRGSKRLSRMTYRQALRQALDIALQDKRVVVFGEGVDDPGGVFGTTLDLHKKYGRSRVFDTPVAENTLTGLAIGAALAGLRPVLVHARTDFMLVAMDQLINHAAKWKYMFGGKVSVPLVIRAIIGGGWGSAAQHSQPLHALFAHTPGLKVVMPATASDAKGLLLASIADPGPVVFIEHRWLYDSQGEVSKKAFTIPLGKAIVRKKGGDVTIVASSFMVALSLEASRTLQEKGIDAEVIDLRTVKPLDLPLILRSVKKTGRLVIADCGWKFSGISAEVASLVSRDAFMYLKAPVERIGLEDAPIPASPVLEKAFYPTGNDIVKAAMRAVQYRKR